MKTLGGAIVESIDSHGHSTDGGLFHLHFEITGSVGLGGEGSGDVVAEGLLGFSFGISSAVDLRAGYEFPLSSPNEFDSGFVTGIVWHF